MTRLCQTTITRSGTLVVCARGGRAWAGTGPGRLLVAVVLLAAAAGCGKRGNPLPPFSRIPHATADLAVRRIADDVTISFTTPWSNIDNSTADLARVDVYAYTAEKAITDGKVMLRVARRVATVPVLPRPAGPDEEQRKASAAADAVRAIVGATPGGLVRVVEHLAPDAYQPVVLPAVKGPIVVVEPPVEPRLGVIEIRTVPALKRFYAAVTVARDGRTSDPSAPVALSLDTFAPGPPRRLLAQYDPLGITLMWDPPAKGVHAPIQRPAVEPPPATGLAAAPLQGIPTVAPTVTREAAEWVAGGEEPAAVPPPAAKPAGPPLPAPGSLALTAGALPGVVPGPVAVPVPPLAARPLGDLVQPFKAQWSPTAYNVYEVPAEAAEPAAPWEVPLPVPLNKEPLPDLQYVDARIEFGATRCYVVRAQNQYEKGAWEGVATAPVCVTPRDVFPPEAPRSPAAVATPGAVSLIWTAGAELDLAGYIVLRGAPGSATLQRLTPAPVREARYRDESVTPGTRYVYVVVAVDTAGNESDASGPVEAVVP